MKTIARAFREEASPQILLASGLVVFPAFLFQPALSVRFFTALVFLFLAAAVGKRIRPVATIVMSASIVAFNLIVPFGRVLFSIGDFRITSGALSGGFEKAVTIEGLIWLSQVLVRPDVRFPGVSGELLAGTFGYFARITEERKSIDRKDIFGSLDALLVRLWDEGPARIQETAKKGTGPGGIAAIAALVALCLLPYLFLLFGPLPAWLVWN
jgi:hypothetical protein